MSLNAFSFPNIQQHPIGLLNAFSFPNIQQHPFGLSDAFSFPNVPQQPFLPQELQLDFETFNIEGDSINSSPSSEIESSPKCGIVGN